MRRSVSSYEFSFLSITPLPGMAKIKQESVGLLALTVCEGMAAVLDSASWALMLWVIAVCGVVGAACGYTFKVSESRKEAKVICLRLLYRVCLGLKLATLCVIAGISIHTAFFYREAVCFSLETGFQPCEARRRWWNLSVPTLAIQGVLAFLGSLLLCILLSQLQKVSRELRYRSLTHYLEL